MTEIDETSVRIAVAADQIRTAANAVGLPHALQGRTYGHAAETVKSALTCGFEDANELSTGEAELLARMVYETMLDCGEGVAYCLDYHGIKIIGGLPLPEWARLP